MAARPHFLGQFSQSLFFGITLATLAIDTILYPGFVAQYFLDSRVIALIFVTCAILLRLARSFSLLPVVEKLNAWLVTPFSLITFLCAAIESRTYTNYIFSTTHIHYEHLIYILMIMATAWILNKPSRWLHQHKHTLILASPILLFLLALHIRTWPWDVFVLAVKEDNFIEYLQFFCLFLAGIAAIWKSTNGKMFQLSQRGVFLFAGVVLLIVAGEEISWGQRLLGLSTPESLASINKQQEITIHNIGGIDENVFYAYVVVGFSGALAWIFTKALPRAWKKFLKPFIPPWYLVGFYSAVFFYNAYALLHQHKHMIGEWSEPSELMLHLGILLTLLM